MSGNNETARRLLPPNLDDAENGLSGRFRKLLHGLWQDLVMLDEQVAGWMLRVKTAQRRLP